VLAFTTLSGRFILATNENLLLRTIANINRKTPKDSLADDPAFQTEQEGKASFPDDLDRNDIIHLQAGNLRRELLEKAIARAAQGRLTVAGRGSEPAWENRKEGEHSWRQLPAMLGWEICYAIKDGELIVANSAELLKTVFAASAKKRLLEISAGTIDDLTIVRFDQRKSAFDDIMKRLDNDGTQGFEAFFSGNIGSLLDVGV
jgi:hypothetical protein